MINPKISYHDLSGLQSLRFGGAIGANAQKLDEAIGMGALMSVARRVPLPISYLTTGQDVPDDIEHAQARRMARLVLGEETLGSSLKNQ